MESCLTEMRLHPYKTLHLVPEPCLLTCSAVWKNIFITDFWFHDVMQSNANIERQQPHLQSPVIFFLMAFKSLIYVQNVSLYEGTLGLGCLR